MNDFYCAVGLSGYSENDLEDIFRQVESQPDTEIDAIDDEGKSPEKKIEITRYIKDNLAIRERGFIYKDGTFVRQNVFPIVDTDRKAAIDNVDLIELKNRRGSLVKVESWKLGCILFSYVQNLYEVTDGVNLTEEARMLFNGITLTGLSNSGVVILPKGDDKDKELEKIEGKRQRIRNELSAGKEEAYEELTLTEMEIYSKIENRVKNKGVYGVVQDTFMPKSVEEDVYFVIGTIEDFRKTSIDFNGQLVYQLDLNCCGFDFVVAINSRDLFGEPKVGRRFKGKVWMQSKILM
ncbi:MAG: DUF3881 family protein [bacterium LCO1.1]|uniref:DUF3881 family protein n=1 Tax=Candidatus Weimeria bifida TaxID=2599074 RepID=A0A6N7J080_9FIRM|nr:DUF3881 family protein [Candidatus Weimeria bifida]